MKIAVATSDGVQLSQHFGRSAGFLVFEIEGTAVKNRELRSNHHTAHAQGVCDDHHHHDRGAHSHAGVVGLLQDCEVVLCGGMGSGAANALKANGIRTLMVPKPCSADEALQEFLSGQYANFGPACCNFHC